MLNWLQRFNIFCFLDNCNYNLPPHQYECLVGAGAAEQVQYGTGALDAIDSAGNQGKWWFGHLSFELQHPSFGISQVKEDPVGFPLFYFFRPLVVAFLRGDELVIEAENPGSIYQEIMEAAVEHTDLKGIVLRERFSEKEYTRRVGLLKDHMQRGDCYELNFCQEFFAAPARIDPYLAFKKLVRQSPSPFAALYRLDDRFLVCASPERFLAKDGNRIVAQPIKGTAARGADAVLDEKQRQDLRRSSKEQAENVMIVDLMRNDLSKICQQGSVQVDELLGIYSFPHVHQMISTISGTLTDVRFSEILKATFPMGSMTGAPKHRVLQLISEYEPVARGIFSGTVGYIDPSGDFDFNVVIRSILYNESRSYVSCQAGSAITVYANAAAEWAECLLKIEAIKKVLAAPALL